MRAEGFPPLQSGDWMTVTDGLYAGIDGRVLEVREVSDVVLRVRLELPWGDEEWHPVWNEAMDESEWLSTRDTAALERYLSERSLQYSERKYQLYRVGCVRRVWDLLPDDRYREAIETGERFADGQATAEELRGCLDALVRRGSGRIKIRLVLGSPTQARMRPDIVFPIVRHFALEFRNTQAEADAQREILRDVFGNPFRKAVIDPCWLSWQAGLIVQLARMIYDEHRFSELPVLADALEDAGCRDEVLLQHCRREAPHARGCWLLDALLGLA